MLLTYCKHKGGQCNVSKRRPMIKCSGLCTVGSYGRPACCCLPGLGPWEAKGDDTWFSEEQKAAEIWERVGRAVEHKTGAQRAGPVWRETRGPAEELISAVQRQPCPDGCCVIRKKREAAVASVESPRFSGT